MFCSQCGSKIADAAVFCPTCGHKVMRAQSQPQMQVEPAVTTPVQQPQPLPYVAPQAAPQPAPAQLTKPQPYAAPQAAPQPVQAQQPQPQPYAAQQAAPRPVQAQQPQPQVQQPRPQAQPYPAQNIPPQNIPPQNGNPQNAPKPKKKKKKGGIIALVIVLVLLLLAVIAGGIVLVITSGVLKNPKKVFAENVVGVSKNINNELPNIGAIPLDAFFHLGVDDTNNSHTSTRTTYFSSDEMPAYDLELEQVYSYNADNGDAAYDFTVTASGTPLGTGSIYFSDDQFLFVPMDPSASMVKYKLDSSAQESFKNVDAINRFAKMMAEADKREEIDWDESMKTFTEIALADLPKNRFKKDKALYSILGEEKKCKTVSLTVTDDDAVNLVNGLGDLIYGGIINADEDDLDTFNSLTEAYSEKGGDIEVTMTTYRYKKTPVAIVADVTYDKETYTYEISYYSKKSEKQMILTGTSDGETSGYEESVISTGIGKYSMTTKFNTNGYSITILQDGHIVGNSKEITGTFEIVSDKTPSSSTASTVTSVTGNKITGTIEETALLGNGTKTTVFETENGSLTISTSMTRESLDTSKITPPTFLSESGVDCGKNLDDLKTALDMNGTSDVEIDNSLYSMALVYILMIKNAGMF